MAQVITIRADITTLSVDAIVNAANSTLLGGGGVDGAIHRAAGPELKIACAALGGCPAGAAKTTPGFALPARWVIHTVGPVWKDGHSNEAAVLSQCYLSCLKEASRLGVATIAFPAISCGIYGFPAAQASRIAVDTVMGYLAGGGSVFEEILFCCFNAEVEQAYRQALRLHAL